MQLEIGEFHESVNDAMQAAVMALGGYKKVGPMLRPELSIEHAAQWLRDCLNVDRREKLGPEQVLLLLRTARAAGYHAAMDFIAFDAGYKATPIDPQSQMEQLQEQFISAVDRLEGIRAQMQRVPRVRAA